MIKIRLPWVATMLLTVVSVTVHAQATNIEEEYDLLTAKWLEHSGKMKTYGGLAEFCTEASFRGETVQVLELIHHYDSLLLDILFDPSLDLSVSAKEYKHALRDIQGFEREYGVKQFITFLKGSCNTRNELERNKETLMKESGMYSYDGQILVLETELRKYLKVIDKKVLAIDDHVHLIHPDHVRPWKVVAEQ